MKKYKVSIVPYEKSFESVNRAVELCGGLNDLSPGARVFIKPNIVFWTRKIQFPKWGVITTSRVVEDVVVLLKEHGINDITIGEGMITSDPEDRKTPGHAFKTLGYDTLKNRYNIKIMNVFEHPFQKVDLGDGVRINFNVQVLQSDFLVNLPVMKTHAQTVVSLGIKNLKGLIDIPSRKNCHKSGVRKDLHYRVARLADKMPPMLTLIDGIFTNERGPGFDGTIRRKNILVASSDVLSADYIGAKILGYSPEEVPYLYHAARNHKRSSDLSEIQIEGLPLEKVSSFHRHDFPYNDTPEGIMPVPMARKGIRGLYYHKYDLSICTYCSYINGLMLSAIQNAWKGKPFDQVEILTGKKMKPTKNKKKTILLGKCMVKANKNHPDINELIAVKECPPKPESMVKALHQAGIQVNPSLFENIDLLPGYYMKQYIGKPEYDETLFKVK